MSLQWLSAAAFLYAEIGLGVLFSLEFISNASLVFPSLNIYCMTILGCIILSLFSQVVKWQQIFTSRLLALVKQYGNFLFNSFILLMFILFVDSATRAYKYSNIDNSVDLHNNPQAEIQAHMRLFRAQRNLYITGFSLFMLIILRRLITLISRQATLEASHAAALKQAQGASDQAKKLLDENEKLTKGQRKQAASSDASGEEEEKGKNEETIKLLKDKLTQREKELETAETDLSTMKKQSENLHQEYDRLSDEHNKLEKRLRILSEPSDNQRADDLDTKKDDW